MLLTHLYRFILHRRFDTRVAPGERILIVTRSISDTLYERSQSLLTLPYPRRRIVGFNHWRNAVDYLHLLFEYPVDWIINIDEDCFVFDNARIDRLLRYMDENGYDYCGVPDGGACIHRFHNPLVTNPFFNIFNVARIRPRFRAADFQAINGSRHAPELEAHTPRHLLKEGHNFAFDNFECYYGVFFWLLHNGFKPLYLPSIELEDGLTTEVRDIDDIPFLYHTWFARQYATDDAHRQRIDHAYEMAMAQSQRA